MSLAREVSTIGCGPSIAPEGSHSCVFSLGDSAIDCMYCHRRGEAMLTQDLTPKADENTAALAWLVSALEHTRSRGQAKIVGYLGEVADDMVFEVECAARRNTCI